MNDTVWARLCRRCQNIDLAAAWGRREDAEQNLDWSCSRCGARDDWELVKVERAAG